MRDTIYSALMFDINGIPGPLPCSGGLRHGVQAYNVDSGNTYLTMILCAVGVSMIVPEFIPAHDLEGLFDLQHPGHAAAVCAVPVPADRPVRRFFSYRYAHRAGQSPQELHAESEAAHDPSAVRNSAALLVTGLVLIGALSEVMAKTIDVSLVGSGMPVIVPGMLVALISAEPGDHDCIARRSKTACSRSSTSRSVPAVDGDPDRAGDRGHRAA